MRRLGSSPYLTRGATTKKDRATPSTNTLYLRTAAGTVPVRVTRKRVRNFNLRVRADGSVWLSMPQRATLAAAQDMLERHATWVERRVARAQAQARQSARGLLETGYVPLWGRRAELRVQVDTARTRASVRLLPGGQAEPEAPGEKDAGSNGTQGVPACAGAPQAAGNPRAPFAVITMTLPGGLDDAELDAAAQALVDRVYRAEIARVLPEVARAYEKALGVHATHWSLRRMKTRWGSCTPKTGRIRLNVQLAAYPPYCLGYVVAHELTHLLEASHNARFHALLNGCCSAAVKARKRLRQPPLDEGRE